MDQRAPSTRSPASSLQVSSMSTSEPCNKCKTQTRGPDDSLCPWCRCYRDLSNVMRTFNKSRAAQESAEAKDLQAKRAAHTAFGRLEFNRNFWAKRRKTATATGGSAPAESNVEAELELEDETAADAAAIQTAGENGDGGSNTSVAAGCLNTEARAMPTKRRW